MLTVVAGQFYHHRIGMHLEAVVVLPEGYAEVPGVHDGDAQLLHHRQRQLVAPATVHNNLHRLSSQSTVVPLFALLLLPLDANVQQAVDWLDSHPVQSPSQVCTPLSIMLDVPLCPIESAPVAGDYNTICQSDNRSRCQYLVHCSTAL